MRKRRIAQAALVTVMSGGAAAAVLWLIHRRILASEANYIRGDVWR